MAIVPVRLGVKRVSEALERAFRRRGTRKLVAIQGHLGVNARELGQIFGGVTRQAVEQWMQRGVPVERYADVDRVAELAEQLAATFERERLPSIVRAKLPALDGRTILESIERDGPVRAFALLERLHSWSPGA